MSDEVKVTYTDDFKSKYKVVPKELKMKTNKEQIIETLMNILEARFRYIRDDKQSGRVEKIEKEDVILNVMKFLQNYDENIKILDKIEKERHYKEKYKADKPKMKYSRAKTTKETRDLYTEEQMLEIEKEFGYREPGKERNDD